VAAGDLAEAARTLGRPYAIEGVVVVGDRRGRDLGFPTANLDLDPGQPLPPKGIYAGSALGHRAAISIGVNPHFGGTVLRVEAHLLDFEGELYGLRMRLELWKRLRDERSFASEADLVAAIADDVAATRRAVRP
jgi:riboflavin kinase/FMN adenylyltransferase